MRIQCLLAQVGCTLVLLSLAAGAYAAPAVVSATGTFAHGASVTVAGSGFSAKSTAAPVAWDDCSTGTYPTDNGKWSGYWPNTGNSTYYLHYTTPIRNISLPHNHITRYMAGCHGENGGAGDGYNVMFWKTRTVSSFPVYTYASWYQRTDDNWVFGGDDNYKCYDWSAGNSPFGHGNMENWYLEYNGRPTSRTSGCAWHINDDQSSLQSPDMNGHSWWWSSAVNPMAGAWSKVEVLLKITDQNDGYIKLWENGSSRINYVGPTDKYGSPWTRSDCIGGYARNYSQPNNWRYFADCYMDYTPSRIVLANNSNLSNATIVENLIPTAWSDTSIAATVNLGKFQSGTAYLFVFDSTNTRNAAGYAVTVGGPPLPSVTVAATDANAAEQGQDPGTFTITRTGDTTGTLSVSYAVSGTATNGVDYTPTLGGTATIPAGASTVDVIITPVDDTAVEDSETVILTISTNASYTVGTPNSATVTIADNDQPPTFKGGDCNKDYKVDGVDLAVLCADWDPLGVAPSHTWAQGDFNGDGKIDGIDLALLCQNWNPLGYAGGASQPNETTLSAPVNSSLSKGAGGVKAPPPARRLVPWPVTVPPAPVKPNR